MFEFEILLKTLDIFLSVSCLFVPNITVILPVPNDRLNVCIIDILYLLSIHVIDQIFWTYWYCECIANDREDRQYCCCTNASLTKT